MAVMLFSSVGHADVLNWNTDPAAQSLSAVIQAGGILVGDKLFYFPSDSVQSTTGGTPTTDEIMLSGYQSPTGDYGLKFTGYWFADAGARVDSNITFEVSVSSNMSSDYLIKGASLIMTSSHTVSTNPHANVTITENIYNGFPAIDQSNQIATLYTSSGSKVRTDSQEFANDYRSIWVTKDIGLYGGDSGEDSESPGATLSAFYQTFSQTPEPQSLVLLLCAAPGLALYLWRRRRMRR